MQAYIRDFMPAMWQTVAQRVQEYQDSLTPEGLMLEPEQIKAFLLDAVRLYMAYGVLECHAKQLHEYEAALKLDGNTPPPIPQKIDDAFPLGPSEWGVIKPLWYLYMERSRALMIEATRIMGDVSHGRSSTEVQQDVHAYESDMHVKAFFVPIVSI